NGTGGIDRPGTVRVVRIMGHCWPPKFCVETPVSVSRAVCPACRPPSIRPVGPSVEPADLRPGLHATNTLVKIRFRQPEQLSSCRGCDDHDSRAKCAASCRLSALSLCFVGDTHGIQAVSDRYAGTHRTVADAPRLRTVC